MAVRAMCHMEAGVHRYVHIRRYLFIHKMPWARYPVRGCCLCPLSYWPPWPCESDTAVVLQDANLCAFPLTQCIHACGKKTLEKTDKLHDTETDAQRHERRTCTHTHTVPADLALMHDTRQRPPSSPNSSHWAWHPARGRVGRSSREREESLTALSVGPPSGRMS